MKKYCRSIHSIVAEKWVVGVRKQGRWRFFGGFLWVFPAEARIPNIAALFQSLEDWKCTRKTPKEPTEDTEGFFRFSPGIIPCFRISSVNSVYCFLVAGYPPILRSGLFNGGYNT
jgi:hypothetical protein